MQSHCSSATVQTILISMNFTFLSAIMGIGLGGFAGNFRWDNGHVQTFAQEGKYP